MKYLWFQWKNVRQLKGLKLIYKMPPVPTNLLITILSHLSLPVQCEADSDPNEIITPPPPEAAAGN